MNSAWWEQWPERLEYELNALDSAGIPWTLNNEAKGQGILCLNVEPSLDSQTVPLIATYPDSYPYFRVEVAAPTLELSHHQNPFGKNLCLMGRRTHFWDTHWTLARLIEERLPLVLQAATTNDPELAATLEQHQGEPFSDYYPYSPGMIIVQSDWPIPAAERYGGFDVATAVANPQRPTLVVRGAMVAIRGMDGQVINAADSGFTRAFSGPVLSGAWVRADRPVGTHDPSAFIEELQSYYAPIVEGAASHFIGKSWLRIIGVLFPEENGHQTFGDGWVFLCLRDRHRPSSQKLHSRGRPPSKRGGSKNKRRRQR